MPKPSPDELFMGFDDDLDEDGGVWADLPLSLSLPEDSWTPPAIEAKGTETSLGSTTILPPEEFKSSFTLADGYVAEIFASEQDFPEVANPLALAFDERHRLWVLCAITYPHLLPGERPRCKLLILEDTDGDGRADERTVFADGLYIPTGFAVDSTVGDTTEVYIGQAPDLLKLTDTDGDSVADVREIIATGFAMPDSHHQVSAFEWDPMGGLWFHEGVFSIANVETPWGVRRTRDAAAWRLDPVSGRLDVMSHADFANPWGLAFDNFGAGILADASGGSNYALSHVVHAFEYPRKPGRPGHIINRGRPTAGAEILYSRHFPDDVQGSFLVNQSIGFHGTRWNRITPEGSSWSTENMPQDLIESSDTNFRPVAIETGPDGAVYLVDWCNPLIGHMQYSTRDPRRDSTHGRIWRIRHETRPLLDPPDIVGASPTELCELLRLPEDNTRQLVRRRLQRLPDDVIESEVAAWFEELEEGFDRDYWRLQLERLWMSHARGETDAGLLEGLVFGVDARARAGAVRVLRHWLAEGRFPESDAARFVQRAVGDEDMHVRLEGVIAAGFMSPERGISLAEAALERSMDGPMRTVLTETLVHLSRGLEEVPAIVRALRLRQTPTDSLLEMEADELVVFELLARHEAPADRRMELLEGLVGEDADAQSALLFDRLAEERELVRGLDLLELVERLPREAVERAAQADERWIEHAEKFLAAKVASVLLLMGIEPERLMTREPGLLVRAAERTASDAELSDRVRARLVEISGEAFGSLRESLDSWERRLALSQAMRFGGEARGAVLDSAVGLVERGWDTPMSDWGQAQLDAMSAQIALHALDPAEWPERAAGFVVERPSNEVAGLGESIYYDEAIGCVRCHASDGTGLEGFPPLVGSKRLLGDPARAASVVLHGLYGALEGADGAVYNSAMEPLGGVLSDEEIAAVLTHARQSWGNFASPVDPETVASERAREVPGKSYWPIAELDEAFPLATDSLGGRLTPVAQARDGAPGGTGPEAPRRRPITWTPLLLFGVSIGLLVVLVGGFGAILKMSHKGS
ncbi:MAG: PVC-type heme-binding CxxCH protein [Phycisphaerales bacterium JB040]